MRKIISIILLIVSPSGIFGAPYFTSIRTIANVHKAIELLINDGDFEYFARLSSKNGIGINRVTSNRQEKEYFFHMKMSYLIQLEIYLIKTAFGAAIIFQKNDWQISQLTKKSTLMIPITI